MNKQRLINKCFDSTAQAMVEFVIMLIIFMTIAAGMLYTNRLLLFDMWAQQEARFLAFEQTWVPHSASSNPVNEPISFLQNGDQIRRPPIIEQLDIDRSVENDGNISDLLPFFARLDTHQNNDQNNEIIMLASARKSIWHRTADDWIDGIASRLSLVEYAVASITDKGKRDESSVQFIRERERDRIRSSTQFSREISADFERILQITGFGENFCQSMANQLKSRYGVAHKEFSDSKCSEKYNRAFAEHLAENVEIAEIFRGISYQLEGGFEIKTALEVTLSKEVASQFYSFFDTFVNAAFQTAPIYTIGAIASLAGLATDGSLTQMMTDMRYVGSTVALAALVGTTFQILSLNPNNRNFASEKALEESINSILHRNAKSAFDIGIIDDGFYLNPMYLPVPPLFGPVAGGLQSGIMRNVLTRDEDLFDPLIDNSNKLIEVHYTAENGLFPAARRRFNTSDKVLSARFYLVTQPWHIPRRESPTGNFRQKGTQFDDVDEVTEEGILRRRVEGFWLFPSRPGALLEPLTELPALNFLAPVTTILETFDGAISTIKGFLNNNPLFKIFDALSNLPIVGNFVPTVPKWPAVRPDAYPGSTEMAGDRMAGTVRNFSDYVDEQEKFNPKPDPEFN